MTDEQAHWDAVWSTKQFDEVSWFEGDSSTCLSLLSRVPPPHDRLLAVGAGASSLVASVIQQGWHQIIAVDMSSAALRQLRERLGPLSNHVTFIEVDVRDLALPEPVDVWHDRATFHFLTERADQLRYVANAAAIVRAGGHLVLANFAPSGPEQCSGLPVARHSPDDLHALFGAHFELVESFETDHFTPWGAAQRFLHALWRRRDTDIDVADAARAESPR